MRAFWAGTGIFLGFFMLGMALHVWDVRTDHRFTGELITVVCCLICAPLFGLIVSGIVECSS